MEEDHMKLRKEIQDVLDKHNKKKYCVALTYLIEKDGNNIKTYTDIINNFDTGNDAFDIIKIIVLRTQLSVNNLATILMQGLPVENKSVTNTLPELKETQYR